MTETRTHRRSSSGHSHYSHQSHHSHAPRSPSPPSQTFHASILPRSVPTPALVESVASGAHYSGARVESDLKQSRSNGDRRSSSHLDVEEDHHKVLEDLKELYCCRPTAEVLKRSWHPDAVFEDPLVRAKGYDEYAAQWFALPKLFSKSERLSTRIMSSTRSPNRLVYFQKQEYTVKLLGTKKVIDSIVTVDLDEENKIIHLSDQWDGKDVPTRFGSGLLRRASGKFTPWVVRVPKN